MIRMLIGNRIRTAQGKDAFKRGLLLQTKKYNNWKKARMGEVLIPKKAKRTNDRWKATMTTRR